MYINNTNNTNMPRISCDDQRRKNGTNRQTPDLRTSLNGISKTTNPSPNPFPNPSQMFTLCTITLLMRLMIAFAEIMVVDGSNALAKGETGNHVTIVVVGRRNLNRYRHLFGNPKVFFLLVDHPRDEDSAIQQVLTRIKAGTKVWIVSGDTKPDPIMLGVLNVAGRGANVNVFSRHCNVSKKWTDFYEEIRSIVDSRKKGGSVNFHGVSADTPPASI
jgi:hypothetical protein